MIFLLYNQEKSREYSNEKFFEFSHLSELHLGSEKYVLVGCISREDYAKPSNKAKMCSFSFRNPQFSYSSKNPSKAVSWTLGFIIRILLYDSKWKIICFSSL